MILKKLTLLAIYLCLMGWTVTSCTRGAPSCPEHSDYIDSLYDMSINLCEFTNLNDALIYAKTADKPILCVYSGLNTMGDRKQMWKPIANPSANQLIRSEFIFIDLHVDDRTALPDSTKVFNFRGDLTETYGELYMNREITRYNMATQPVFTIINYKDEDLIEPISGLKNFRNKEKFNAFLEKALQ